MSMTNCVNCGSAKDVNESVCPFCGTSYFDLTDIDLSYNRKPCVVRFKFNGSVFQMKAFVIMGTFEYRPEVFCITDPNGGTRFFSKGNEISANIEFVSCE